MGAEIALGRVGQRFQPREVEPLGEGGSAVSAAINRRRTGW